MTVRLLSKMGRITQPGHIVGIVRNAVSLDAAGMVGRILMLQEDGAEGKLRSFRTLQVLKHRLYIGFCAVFRNTVRPVVHAHLHGSVSFLFTAWLSNQIATSLQAACMVSLFSQITVILMHICCLGCRRRVRPA